MSEERKVSTRPSFLKWASLVLALGIMGLSIVLYMGQQEFLAPGPLKKDLTIVIPKGSGLERISNILKDEGVIREPLIFQLGARYTKKARNLKAGEFLVPAAASMLDIIEILENGKAVSYSVTIPEGKTSFEIVEILRSNPDLVGEITDVPEEGSLLPETYLFVRGDSRQSILDRMKRALERNLDKLWDNRQEGLPLKTKEEALVLASIVEKETGIASERPLVAGVFINRLNFKMRLQSDPTVTYGITLGTKPLGRGLTRKDLKTPTEYNTYTIDRLPPKPIANVGLSALEAVTQPAKTKYLYFVADGTGGHAFARNLKEHNKNVRHWRSVKKK
ncbi:aminodeoxychorismate lyase [Kiloniella spongiae]|uniref:Endolytic murein transglycosylase n=1 Tax=Kiloniella spongiae TaxID=1489064 RepID=A0A0H2MHJ9_9PROT|nr:aminodeoxychorismate lyase [Kiloniella spongiae]